MNEREFDQEQIENVCKAFLIIAQQEELINEHISKIAAEFGVDKGTCKKILKAWADDKLAKTQEKIEDQRSSLSNAETLIEVVENLSIEREDEDETNE